MSMTRAELQDAAREAFGDAGLAPDADASWATIADMGWLTMAVAEERGGLGLGREALGVIHTELGRSLVRGPALAQLMVVEALASADPAPDRDALLGRAMAGEVMTASLTPGSRLDAVPDADRASHVLRIADGTVSLVPLAGARIAARQTWDATRRLFDVVPAADADAVVLATGDAAATLAARVESMLLLGLAGDALGGADAILALTIEYLGVRRQFGRPLALFQALKHRVADMRTWLSAAEALYWTRIADDAASPAAIGALKAHACAVYRDITEEAVQLHGGIGLTMEHHCHLFLKRATLDAALGGDGDYWEERAGRRALTATG